MTAVFVGRDHVDALISIAVRWGPGFGEDLSWPADDPLATPPENLTYREIRGLDLDDTLELNAIGTMLLLENARSLIHRYGEAPELTPYEFRPVEASWLEAVERCFRPIDAYRYQASEHPDWIHSEASRFCDALEQTLIVSLPEYESGPWVYRRV